MMRSPENPFQPVGSPSTSVEQRVERAERFLDAVLLELLERQARKVNEGQNGVIFRLRTEQLSDEVKARLADAGVQLEGDNVAKILKLNAAGMGKKEFEMHRRSHALITSQPEARKYARIPSPKMYRSLRLTKSSEEYLNEYGVKTLGGTCEMIVMDEIQGDDVATALYKEVIRRHPKTVHIRDHVDDMDFVDLQGVVADALEYVAPGGKSRDEQERQFEERKIFASNSAKLFHFLAKRGFRVDARIVEKMERTMELFHANGLCHRDAHHRNFMVIGGLEQRKPDEPEPDIFVIDFGTMTAFDGPFSEELYTEQLPSGEIKNYPSDLAVPRDLRTHFMPEAAERERDLAFQKTVSTLQARLLSRSAWRDMLGRFESGIFGQAEIASLFTASPEPKPETFFAAIQALRERGNIDMQVVKLFLEAEKRKRPTAELNKINQFLRLLR